MNRDQWTAENGFGADLPGDAITAAVWDAANDPQSRHDDQEEDRSMNKPPKWHAERAVDDSGFETGKLHIIMRGAPCAYDFDLPEDAQLASAAPEMLEALETLTEIVSDQLGGDFPEPLQAARAAIAKARGNPA